VTSFLIIGIFALRYSQMDLFKNAREDLNGSLQNVSDYLVSQLNKRDSVMVSAATNSDLKIAINENNKEQLTATAKNIYEKLDGTQRVLIYNAEGEALGVYPRNSLAEGTDFSSRQYFQITKQTYRKHTSGVFENILGENTIMQTEPIFENNQFMGMIGVALDLTNISLSIQNMLGKSFSFDISDKDGVIALSSDAKHIGLKKSDMPEAVPVSHAAKSLGVISSSKENSQTSWTIAISQSPDGVLYRNTSLNVIFSVLLFVNSLFSIFLGVGLAGKIVSRESETKFPNSQLNPHYA